jgi:hypothetical protein
VFLNIKEDKKSDKLDKMIYPKYQQEWYRRKDPNDESSSNINKYGMEINWNLSGIINVSVGYLGSVSIKGILCLNLSNLSTISFENSSTTTTLLT